MRMPKIKPLRVLYRLITDTELCFSAEVNWDNREEISPDVPILNWLLPKKISDSKEQLYYIGLKQKKLGFFSHAGWKRNAI